MFRLTDRPVINNSPDGFYVYVGGTDKLVLLVMIWREYPYLSTKIYGVTPQ